MHGPASGDARLRDLEAAVARLSARLEYLEVLEHNRHALPATGVAADRSDFRGAAVDVAPVVAPIADAVGAAPGWLGLVGRTCIVLGGAFLLRALTQSGQLPVAGGVWLGLAYAALWLALAGRAVGASGLVHGIAALLVALPLLLEAVLRFGVLSPGLGSALIATIAIVVLIVAWRRRQRTLAMLTTLGTVTAVLVLALGASTMLAPVLALIAIGITSLWIGYGRNWNWLPLPAAAAADLAILFLALRAMASPPRDEPLPAAAAHALLIVVYLGSFMIRVGLHDRDVQMFEVVQTAVALTLGLFGGISIARAQGIDVTMIALPALMAGGLLYAQTFLRIAPRRGFGPEFYYLGMTALTLVLVGASLLFAYPMRPIVIASGALLAILIAWRAGHPMLALQGAIVAVVAAAQSGLVTFTAIVWLTHSQPWPTAAMPIWIVLAAVSAALLIPRAVHDDEPAFLASTARVALAIALVAGAGSLVVIGAAQLLSGLAADPGVFATMKTVILSAAAVGLAMAGRSPRFVELGWLAYGVLAAGGAKILFEDFPTSRPSTMFIALAAYGAALILVPRVSRTSAHQTTP